MGTCATKLLQESDGKPGFELPLKDSFTKDYNPTNEFFSRSETASVFRATSKGTNLSVLVKQLAKTVSKQSVVNEIYFLSTCDHPHIIKLLDFFQTESHYFIVYQYHGNCNLLDYFKDKETKTTIEDLKALFKQILMTVKYLHSRNIFHGSLDFSNLFFGDNQLCVTGFNYSKHLSPATFKSDQLINHETSVAPGFEAPEAAKKKYGLASDIWSIGVIFYSLITAEMPFNGSSKKKVRAHSLDTVFLVKKGAPPELADLIDQALTKNHKNRPSAETLLNHPFFKAAQSNTIHCIVNALQDIKAFAMRNMLSQRMYLEIGRLTIGPREKAVINDTFHAFDTGHDGVITFEEFMGAIQRSGLSFKEKEARRLFDQLDQNHNNEIEYAELSAVFASTANQESLAEGLKGFFHELDSDKDNFISIGEFKSFFTRQIEQASEIETSLKLFHSKQKLSYDEFASLLKENLQPIA